MSTRLPPPPARYAQENEAQLRALLEREDARNYKKDEDVEIARNRLVLTDTATGVRYALTVASGSVTLVAL